MTTIATAENSSPESWGNSLLTAAGGLVGLWERVENVRANNQAPANTGNVADQTPVPGNGLTGTVSVAGIQANTVLMVGGLALLAVALVLVARKK